MGKRRAENMEVNMTPMIDVVFQLIIFFIVTLKLEEDLIDKKIELARSRNGPTLENLDPKTVTIEVTRRGVIKIAKRPFSPPQLEVLMGAAARRFNYQVPVLVRGDQFAQHKDIRKVMDVCAGVGLWRIKFAALKKDVTEQ